MGTPNCLIFNIKGDMNGLLIENVFLPLSLNRWEAEKHVLLLFFGGGECCACSMWKFPDQGSNLHHSSDYSHCSDNPGVLNPLRHRRTPQSKLLKGHCTTTCPGCSPDSSALTRATPSWLELPQYTVLTSLHLFLLPLLLGMLSPL